MAGDNVVRIEFQADDASTTAAFSRLNAEVSNLGGAGMGKAQASMAEWRKETGLSEQATIGASREMASLGAKAGKTAADFKPATAEMRAASIATKEVGEAASSSGGLMEGMVGRLVGASAAFEVLRLVAEGVKYAVGSSMELESADVRFKSLAGNTDAATKAFAGMSQVADATQTSVVELSKAGVTLLEAGVPMDQINDKLKVMATNAKIAHESLQENANIDLRLSRGEVGARDLAAISRTTGDETGRLQAQYRDISVTIPLAAKEMERLQSASARTRQDHDKIAERLEQDNDLLASQSMHDRDLAVTRSHQDEDQQRSRAREDWEGQRSLGQTARGGPLGARTPGGFVPDEGPAQQETYTKFGKGGAIIEGSYERKIREEKNRQGFAAEDRAREDKRKKEDREREDGDTIESRARAANNVAAGRDRSDSGTEEQRAYQDKRAGLELRKEKEKAQLIEDARNELAGEGDSRVWDAVMRQRNYQAYKETARGQADGLTYGVQKDASHAGSALKYGYDVEASQAESQGTMQFPWSKKTGSAEDDKWLSNLSHLAPGKAQQLGMSEESAKILIQKQTEANAHLRVLAAAFSGS